MGNPTMGALAAAALINISHNNKDVKQMLMAHGVDNIIMSKLNSKSEPVLLNTLMMCRNLAKTTEFRNKLIN